MGTYVYRFIVMSNEQVSRTFAPLDPNDDIQWRTQSDRVFAPLPEESIPAVENVADYSNTAWGRGIASRIKKQRKQAETLRVMDEITRSDRARAERKRIKYENLGILPQQSEVRLGDSNDFIPRTFEDLE
jgi:hypothetical protein